MWMVSTRCGISMPITTTGREGDMAWNETPREKYKRSSERYESDLTDGEWRVIELLLLAPSNLGRRRSVALRAVFDAIQYMLATRDAQVFSAPLRRSRTTSMHGAPATRARAHDGRAARSCAGAGWVHCVADGGHDRQPVGEDDGDGRPVGMRRRQEDQGQEVPCHGGRGENPRKIPGLVQLAACRFLIQRVAREITL